ncbi:hypothetical protein [Paraburkholderia azotifigens]|uniref:Uncharacterized protein n=1 Tax=Paraburkholderia azotifigens TaxID=2057004 RepID=A0ABU9QZJ7_9BURK
MTDTSRGVPGAHVVGADAAIPQHFLVFSVLDGKCFAGVARKTLFFGRHSAANFLNIRVFYVSLIKLVAANSGDEWGKINAIMDLVDEEGCILAFWLHIYINAGSRAANGLRRLRRRARSR